MSPGNYSDVLLLQTTLRREDGQPCKVQGPQSPQSAGLVLDWVYGLIKIASDRAREYAQGLPGMSPDAPAAL